jgi:hypothetical protein
MVAVSKMFAPDPADRPEHADAIVTNLASNQAERMATAGITTNL